MQYTIEWNFSNIIETEPQVWSRIFILQSINKYIDYILGKLKNVNHNKINVDNCSKNNC